jgi:hypothetical protein
MCGSIIRSQHGGLERKGSSAMFFPHSPLSAKTKVPDRSSASGSDSMTGFRYQAAK